ncbi:MAG: hypothetical protein AAFR14_10735, partial [Bacteroidota bacterium]
MRPLLLPFIVLISIAVHAQVPYAFNYQGVARDVDGEPIADKEISLLISLLSGSEEGFTEFSE